MEYQYLKDNILTTQSLIDAVKEETRYELDNLMGLFPFLRADRSGQHRIIILLVRKTETAGTFIPTQVLSCDIATGTVVKRERAERFYASLQPDVERPISAVRKNIDKELQAQYKSQILPLMDKIRLSIIENGETAKELYLEYLKCTLYAFSDEFAQVLLRISRTYKTSQSMRVECNECRKQFSIDTTDFVNGQIVNSTCPFCQNHIRTAYNKTGQPITYTDQYMQEYRTRAAAGVETSSAQQNKAFATVMDTEGTFVVEETLKGKQNNVPTAKPAESTANVVTESIQEESVLQNNTIPAEATYTAPAYENDETTTNISDNAYSADYLKNVNENALFDLSHQKRTFAVARYMLFETEYDAPPVIMTLKGDAGCGIRSSILNLSGFSKDEISFISLEDATDADFTFFKPCLVFIVSEKPKQLFTRHTTLNNCIQNMKKGQAIFFTGSANAIASLMEQNPYLESKVLYDLIYKPYTIETLCNIFKNRMERYGTDASAITSAQAMLLFAQKNAIYTSKLCSRLYFKHLLAVAENRNGIEEEFVSEQEINQMIPKNAGNNQTT